MGWWTSQGSRPGTEKAQPDKPPDPPTVSPNRTARPCIRGKLGRCAACQGEPSQPRRDPSQGAWQINVLQRTCIKFRCWSCKPPGCWSPPPSLPSPLREAESGVRTSERPGVAQAVACQPLPVLGSASALPCLLHGLRSLKGAHGSESASCTTRTEHY